MRKLASIQQVEEILPIEGADAIEKARIKGWWVVVKKSEFKPGDLCIYFEIDSLLPDIGEFTFLRRPLYEVFTAKGWETISKEDFETFEGEKRQGFQKLKKQLLEDGKEDEGHRLKTIRLRGQISQGLALPFSAFQRFNEFKGLLLKLEDDMTDRIGVYKYEPPIPADLAGEAKGAVPSCIPKTDEERIQNVLGLLDFHKGKRFYCTIKLDGTSNTIYRYNEIFNGELGVCGHNWDFKESEKSIFWRFANNARESQGQAGDRHLDRVSGMAGRSETALRR